VKPAVASLAALCADNELTLSASHQTQLSMPEKPIVSSFFLRMQNLDAPDLWLYSHKPGKQWMVGGASILMAEL
jgi:hypothetical protein